MDSLQHGRTGSLRAGQETKLMYISGQITKAERQGWFDKINFPNATNCVELLKEIRRFCDQPEQEKQE